LLIFKYRNSLIPHLIRAEPPAAENLGIAGHGQSLLNPSLRAVGSTLSPSCTLYEQEAGLQALLSDRQARVYAVEAGLAAEP
jgi:hypothetical protein